MWGEFWNKYDKEDDEAVLLEEVPSRIWQIYPEYEELTTSLY